MFLIKDVTKQIYFSLMYYLYKFGIPTINTDRNILIFIDQFMFKDNFDLINYMLDIIF